MEDNKCCVQSPSSTAPPPQKKSNYKINAIHRRSFKSYNETSNMRAIKSPSPKTN